MNRLTILTPAMLLAVVACTTTPERYDALETARSTVQRVGAEPLAPATAGPALEKARAALSRADALVAGRGSREQIEHEAYLAQRNAEVAQAQIDETQATQRLKAAEADSERTQMAAREREASRAQAQAQSAQAQAQSAQSQVASLQTELAALQAKQTERGMVVTLGDVLFDTSRSDLKAGAGLVIDRVGDFLRDSPQTRVLVEGHTDSRGDDGYNQQLSQQRADAVASALRSRGIDSSRVEAQGRGEGYPIASNETAVGQQQNRRVEIVFSDNGGAFKGQALR